MQRTFLLPQNSSQSYDIVDLPDYSDLTKTSKYLHNENGIFELKLVEKNPRSIIYEAGNFSPGQVSESSEIIVATKFNLVYLLISSLYNSTKQTYVTLENIIDDYEWVSQLPEAVVAKALESICDQITENGEDFYRINKDKTKEYVKQKVEKVKQYLEQSKMVSQLKMNLYVDSEAEIPPGMLDTELLFAAHELILSYLCVSLDLYEFEELIKHKKSVESRLAAKSLAIEAQKPNNSKPTKKAASKPVKKAAKVAKGKGALDMFFKKK